MSARVWGLTAPVEGKEPSHEAHMSCVPKHTVEAGAFLDTVSRKAGTVIVFLGRDPLKAAKRNTVGTEVLS